MTRYTDKDSNTYWIPLTVVVRLYELAKHECERNGKDFEVIVNAMFDADNKGGGTNYERQRLEQIIAEI
jgi:hypothetical protein